MRKEHPVVTPSSDDDPHAQHSDSDYSLDTDDSPHSVDSYQLSTEDDDDQEDSNSSPTLQLHKALPSPPASLSTLARDLDGEVDDFFLVEPEHRSPSPRPADDLAREPDNNYHTSCLYLPSSPQVSREGDLDQAHTQALGGEPHQHASAPSALELALPTLTPPQSPHALPPPSSLVSSDQGMEKEKGEEEEDKDKNKGKEKEEEKDKGMRRNKTQDETIVPSQTIKEGPRTVQLVNEKEEEEDDDDDESSDKALLLSPPATPVAIKPPPMTDCSATVTTTTTDKPEVSTSKKKKGAVLPPGLHTGPLRASPSSGGPDISMKNDPERGPYSPTSSQSRPRSSSLISGAPRSPRTPKSVAFAPDVKDAPDEHTVPAKDDADSSDTSSDEEKDGKDLQTQEYQVLLLGTARNTQDVAKTCTKIRNDLRRMSRNTVVDFTARFEKQVDMSECSEFDLCVYFIQALGAQPQDAEFLLDLVQRTATLVIISSHSTAPLSRQVAIDTRRHLGVYLNKAMPSLPLLRNPFRAARLSQDYESDAELILRNAVSMKELPRINVGVLLDSIQRGPARARLVSSWDWHDRLPSLRSMLSHLLFFACICYLSYTGHQYWIRPKPPAHALLSNLSYDMKHGFATCSLDLKSASGHPYRSKERHPFTIRVLSTDGHITAEDSEAFLYRSSDIVHHTFPGDNKQVVLVNIQGMGLDACNTAPDLYLHIWFQNGTRVPSTPIKLVLPEEQKNCPTPLPAPVPEQEQPPTVWEKVQRVVASTVPFSQGTPKAQWSINSLEKEEKRSEQQRDDIHGTQRQKQQKERSQKEQPKQQPKQQKQQQQQQQQRSKTTDGPRHHAQQQQQQRKSKTREDEYDNAWAAAGDWTNQWNRFSSTVVKQFQSAELPKYVQVAVDEMLGAFQDMYHFCQSASYALRDMVEDAREHMQQVFQDFCDDTYPILKQVRRSSHKYKKAVRQKFRCYYNQVKAKVEMQDREYRLQQRLQQRFESAKKKLERIPMDRFAGVVDRAVFEANLRVQTLMKAQSMEDALQRWNKMQLFEQRLRNIEKQMSGDRHFARMDPRTRRQHAIQLMVLQGYWVPGESMPTLVQHGKEQWRSFKRRFFI